MMRSAPTSLLAALLAVGSAASGQESEYLLEGRDLERGDFTGRLVLRAPEGAPTRYTADRWVQFLEGSQTLLGGVGERDGWYLPLRFEPSSGLADEVSGEEPAADPITYTVSFYADGTLTTKARQGEATLSKGVAYVVSRVPITERPEPASSSDDYGEVEGVPFLQGEGDAHEVDVNDVGQGGLGDCYFMAGIGAVARTDPHRIRSMIETNPDGSFSVYLFKHDYQWGEEELDEDGYFVPQVDATRIVVDRAFPMGWGSSPAYAEYGDSAEVDGERVHELWPMILEKAYAQHETSYSEIEGGWASTPMSFFSGEDAVVDHDPTELPEDQLRETLREAAEEGYPATFGCPDSVSDLSLYGNHYYIFAGVDDEGRAKLLNPWGSSHPRRPLTMAEVKEHIDAIHVGEF